MKITNCKNCGAPINWNAHKCDYCDTEYWDDFGIFELSRYQPTPIPQLVAKILDGTYVACTSSIY